MLSLAPNATHLQNTLNEIHTIANDVEMKVLPLINSQKQGHTLKYAPLSKPSESEYGAYMIVDTNILLHHYEALRSLVDDVNSAAVPLIVVIPGIVVQELDR